MRARQHVNPLCSRFLERPALPDVDLSKPIEAELGCADAQFLFERAEVEPNRVYLGFEVREPLVDLVNENARDRGVPVRAMLCSVNHHLVDILGPRNVERIYLNFPDPWFKRKHHKRRMIDGELIDAIGEVLAPGKEVFFQSDVWDVAIEVMDLFERRCETFRNLAGPWSFWKDGNPFGARSWRETHCEADGLPIWRIRYQRR